jgi:hypothetical protein
MVTAGSVDSSGRPHNGHGAAVIDRPAARSSRAAASDEWQYRHPDVQKAFALSTLNRLALSLPLCLLRRHLHFSNRPGPHHETRRPLVSREKARKRIVSVCRWGYAAGYLTEADAWARIIPAARIIRHTFTSCSIARRSSVLSDPASPWNRVPWDPN